MSADPQDVDSTAPPWKWPRAAYVHIPFCAHKCGYCDFASLAGVDHLSARYLDALEREMERVLVSPQPVDTIFVGGGTPTRLDLEGLERLTGMIRRWLILSKGGEWTVEANPGTLDAEKAELLAEAGVNRVSLGAQSFHPELLRQLERNHAPIEVERAAEIVRQRFPRWSLDLIFGVPGSTAAQWAEDLNQALALGVSHLSCYGLVFEKGTNLWKERQAGLVQPVDEELERQMYAHTIERLTDLGWTMYEISNFAKSGDESRHNLVYWANDAYFGFGTGAARYIDGERAVNTRDLNAYLKRIEAGGEATGPRERLEPEARARETAMLMLRRIVQGIVRPEFQLRTGFDLDELAGSIIDRFVRRGLLVDDGNRVKLSDEGVFFADSVFSELI